MPVINANPTREELIATISNANLYINGAKEIEDTKPTIHYELKPRGSGYAFVLVAEQQPVTELQNDIWPSTTDGMTLPDELGLQYVLLDGHTINFPNFTQTENFDIEIAPQLDWANMTYTINEDTANGWSLSGGILATGNATVRLTVDVASKVITARSSASTAAEFAEFELLIDRPDPATTSLKFVYIAESSNIFVRRQVSGVFIWEQV